MKNILEQNKNCIRNLLKRILNSPSGRMKIIESFQNFIWDPDLHKPPEGFIFNKEFDESKEFEDFWEVISCLAIDLDYYEPNYVRL